MYTALSRKFVMDRYLVVVVVVDVVVVVVVVVFVFWRRRRSDGRSDSICYGYDDW